MFYRAGNCLVSFLLRPSHALWKRRVQTRQPSSSQILVHIVDYTGSNSSWHSLTGAASLSRLSAPSQSPLISVTWCSFRLLATHYSRGIAQHTANKQTIMYMVALAMVVMGGSYAAVPLYRAFCQATGYGGTVVRSDTSDKVETMEPDCERELTIRFNANKVSGMSWSFKPQQREIKLVPGETALAFYTAVNPTDKPITGIATYNVIPFEAGLYFNKIQCFCFEEQRLNPREEVDMPVFFYIDPDFSNDPALAKVDTIILSYTFFEAKEGEDIIIPSPHIRP